MLMNTIKSYKVEMAIGVVLIILVAMFIYLLPYSLNV